MNQIKLLLLACALSEYGLFGMQKGQEQKTQGEKNLELYAAYKQGDLPAFKKALAEGADVNAEEDNVTRLFDIYSEYSQLQRFHKGEELREKQREIGEFIKLLLAHPQLNINYQEHYSRETILFRMAFEADEDHIKLALAIPGIDVGIKRGVLENTVLSHVVWRLTSDLGPKKENKEVYKRIAQLLLEHGADPAIKDVRGRSVYDQAQKDPEILKLLQDGRAAYLKKLKEMQAAVAQPVQESTALFVPLCGLISELAVGADEVYASGKAAERVGAGAGSAGSAGAASNVELKREAGKQ